MGEITFAKHSFAAVAFTCAMLTLSGCGSGESEAVAEEPSDAEQRSSFSTSRDLVTHLNVLTGDGVMRCKDLVQLIFAETSFQQQFVGFLQTVAAAEDLNDAVISRFGEPLDAARDTTILLSFQNAELVIEKDGRAEIAIEGRDSSLRKLMLVNAHGRWWISGYTWEYSMSEAEQAELPRRKLVFEVDAHIAPPLLTRLRTGEFQTIDSVRAAYRESILNYFRAHPEMFEKITGKPFRPPD